jgi:hypothetical protein
MVDERMYARVFQGHHEGAQILEDLQARFYDHRQMFVRGGQEGDRATAYNLGQRAVVEFIQGQLIKAQEVTSE